MRGIGLRLVRRGRGRRCWFVPIWNGAFQNGIRQARPSKSGNLDGVSRGFGGLFEGRLRMEAGDQEIGATIHFDTEQF